MRFKDTLVAVTWREATIIWDGVVHYHHAGDWEEKQTTGDAPQPSEFGAAEVIEDMMYLLTCGAVRRNVVYRLDLKEWRWDRGAIQ